MNVVPTISIIKIHMCPLRAANIYICVKTKIYFISHFDGAVCLSLLWCKTGNLLSNMINIMAACDHTTQEARDLSY